MSAMVDLGYHRARTATATRHQGPLQAFVQNPRDFREHRTSKNSLQPKFAEPRKAEVQLRRRPTCGGSATEGPPPPRPPYALLTLSHTAFLEKGEPFLERSPQHSVSTKGLGLCASQPREPFSSKTALGDRGDRVCTASSSLGPSKCCSPGTVFRDEDLEAHRRVFCTLNG